LTARLAECAKLLGFKLHDHIIVGGNDFYSFNEHGMI
jgi:DNA repair protein RadC